MGKGLMEVVFNFVKLKESYCKMAMSSRNKFKKQNNNVLILHLAVFCGIKLLVLLYLDTKILGTRLLDSLLGYLDTQNSDTCTRTQWPKYSYPRTTRPPQ